MKKLWKIIKQRLKLESIEKLVDFIIVSYLIGIIMNIILVFIATTNCGIFNTDILFGLTLSCLIFIILFMIILLILMINFYNYESDTEETENRQILSNEMIQLLEKYYEEVNDPKWKE